MDKLEHVQKAENNNLRCSRWAEDVANSTPEQPLPSHSPSQIPESTTSGAASPADISSNPVPTDLSNNQKCSRWAEDVANSNPEQQKPLSPDSLTPVPESTTSEAASPKDVYSNPARADLSDELWDLFYAQSYPGEADDRMKELMVAFFKCPETSGAELLAYFADLNEQWRKGVLQI